MLGEIVSGIGSLVGGLFGKKSADKANRQNIQLQKDFAQKGIQWKVADAKKAGVHPLAALGANTVSYSPSTVGSTALGEGISQFGQDIGRAVNAGSTSDQRASHVQSQILQEQLKGLQLDNAGKMLQNAGTASVLRRSAMVGPPMPSASGVTNTGMAGQSSNYIVGGVSVPRNPLFSDAQVIEDRHGDVAAAGYGLLTIPADAYASAMTSPNFRQALREVQPYRAAANRVSTGYAQSLIPRNKVYPNRRSSYSGGGW